MITLLVPIFSVNIQFSTVVFQKINFVPLFFKKYLNGSFLLTFSQRRQLVLI